MAVIVQVLDISSEGEADFKTEGALTVWNDERKYRFPGLTRSQVKLTISVSDLPKKSVQLVVRITTV